MQNNNLENPIFTVGEYLDYLNTILDIQEYVVQGEVSDVTVRGNTVFFTLSDTNEEAKLECVLWKYKYDKLDFDFAEGLEVQIIGKANIYKPRGKLSFVADKVTPVGEGELQKAFEKLKLRLEKEGYFDKENKKTIPEYIESIGLITSEHGDAKKDFLTHLKRYGFKINFYDVRVEGIQSINNIVEAIKWFNENTLDLDVLVLTRGGGSLESLQSFNSEEVAKAIFSSKIPIICGVGHENDVTISDLVADIRASTPTHAGRIISEPWSRGEEKILDISKSLIRTFENKCNDLKNIYKTYKEYFNKRFEQRINIISNRIYDIELQIESKYKNIFEKVDFLEEKLNYNYSIFNKKTLNNKEEIRIQNNYLNQEFNKWFKFLTNKLEYNDTRLESSNPDLKLKQGYSITRKKGGKIIKNVNEVKLGETIKTSLGSGNLESDIKKK